MGDVLLRVHLLVSREGLVCSGQWLKKQNGRGSCRSVRCELMYLHFVEEIFAFAEFVENPENVTNVDVDATLEFGIEFEVATQCFDIPIEC